MAFLWLGLGVVAYTPPNYTLSFNGESFAVSGGTSTELLPIIPKEQANPTLAAYRKDDNFAVWDQRGLTLRKGKKAKSYRLEDVPVSSQIFEPEEIEAIQNDVSHGKRSLAASGLSGSKRIGQRVYFLVRWDDSQHKPAFEALISVDLDAPEMTPHLVGRVEGTTGSNKVVDDRLFLVNGGIAAVTQRSNDWGVAEYSFATRSFDFVSLGQHLNAWYPSGLYLETTPYNTKVGGLLNRQNLLAARLFEDRGNPAWLDGELPAIQVARQGGKQVIRNCETGLEQTLSDQAQVRRCKNGILAWSPAQNPQHAVLLSYDRWTKLAAWNRGN